MEHVQINYPTSFFGAGEKVYCLNTNAYGSLILMWCSRDNYFSWTRMSLAKKTEHIQNSADFSAANSGWGFFSPIGHTARCNRNKPRWNWLRIRIIFWLVPDLPIIGELFTKNMSLKIPLWFRHNSQRSNSPSQGGPSSDGCKPSALAQDPRGKKRKPLLQPLPMAECKKMPAPVGLREKEEKI